MVKITVPKARNSVATSGPAWGKTVTLRPIASTGPIMKIVSSTTDSKAKAVCSLGLPP